MVSGIEAFGIDFLGAGGPDEATASHSARAWKADRIEDRRRHVEQAGRFIHTVLRKTPGPDRPMNDKGDMKSALVNEITVGALAVLSKAFSVIGGKHDQRLFEKLAAAEESQKIPENLIHIDQLSLVAGLAVAQARVLREVVGQVQVVQMEKQKKWRAGIALHPARRGFHHPDSGPLALDHAGCGLVVKIERAVVHEI